MPELLNVLPWLIAMLVLIGCSAFFSGAEAALFSLRPADRRLLLEGTGAQRLAAKLLDEPERLLSAVLFWNLVVNVTYFAIASIISIRLSRLDEWGHAGAVGFSFGSLLTLIFLGEMLPKSIAVLGSSRPAGWVSVPMAGAVRLLDPVMPLLRVTTLLSQRLIWPGFEPERYLDLTDLKRAVQLSTPDSNLVEQEELVLQNIMMLSEMRADEAMRPRRNFFSFRPPVHRSDLGETIPPSGYLLISEPDSDEIAAAVHLEDLSTMIDRHLEHHAQPVVYVPWCGTVADAWQKMQTQGREVAAVVNEHGETIGILTLEDILETVFTKSASRSVRLLNHQPILQIAPNIWRVTGITSIRRLEHYFQIELPETRNVTVAGAIQEILHRLPETGDHSRWGPFAVKIIEATREGSLLVELSAVPPSREESP